MDYALLLKTTTAVFYDVVTVVIMAFTVTGKKLSRELAVKVIALTSAAIIAQSVFTYFKVFINICTFILIMACIFKVIFEKSWFETINIFIVCFSATALIWLPLRYTLGLILDFDAFQREILLRSITLIIVLMVSKFVPIRKFYEYVSEDKLRFKILLLNLIFAVFIIVISTRLSLFTTSNLAFSLIVISLAINALNLLIYRIIKRSREIQLERANSRSNDIFDELISRLRNKLHEEKNRIQAISMLPSLCGTYEELSNAIAEYTAKSTESQSLSKYLNIQRKFAAALIASKQMDAEALGIDFAINISDYAMTADIDDLSLSEIFGTLIDNAFDAVKNNQMKRIDLQVYSRYDSLTIELSNPHEPVPDQMLKKFFQK